MVEYLADLAYGATRYRCAWFKPSVFMGKFGNSENQSIQKEVYSHLLNIGYRRTFWQLVFPGQIAGLIKRIPPTATGVNEYHVRFYDDGVIECELEVDRWSTRHWSGPRHFKEEGQKLLLSIFKNELKETSLYVKERAIQLIGSKKFTEECVRK